MSRIIGELFRDDHGGLMTADREIDQIGRMERLLKQSEDGMVSKNVEAQIGEGRA
jgi:hypothetical protein